MQDDSVWKRVVTGYDVRNTQAAMAFFDDAVLQGSPVAVEMADRADAGSDVERFVVAVQNHRSVYLYVQA